MSGTLLKAGLRDWSRHPWQAGLAVLGVAVGVAVVGERVGKAVEVVPMEAVPTQMEAITVGRHAPSPHRTACVCKHAARAASMHGPTGRLSPRLPAARAQLEPVPVHVSMWALRCGCASVSTEPARGSRADAVNQREHGRTMDAGRDRD